MRKIKSHTKELEETKKKEVYYYYNNNETVSMYR
jgi:hypothetical protein